MVKPIRPVDIPVPTPEPIPDFVIQAFNEQIKRHFDHRTNSAHVYQIEVKQEIMENQNISETDFCQEWLDVEDTFRKSGWTVIYDKPGYNESYGAYFVFSQQ